MNKDKLLDRHTFVFNEHDSGGESLSITTEFYANGDPITEKEGVYTNQTLSLQSYCNSASFNLMGANITPDLLRQLANELESVRNKIRKN
jgi:hypothetical protein